jgi:hypothetical protein
MIMLPVPDEHYPAMVVALSQLMAANAPGAITQAGSTPATGTGGNVPGVTPRGGEYPATEIQRLKAETLNAATRAMLDLVADRPEQPVPLGKVKSRTGLKLADVRGQLASFTKMLKKRYGRQWWPIRAERDATGRAYYVASNAFAEEWNKKP